MSTKIKTDHELIETVGVDSASGLRSEPGGRAQRPAGGARPLEDRLPDEVRDRLADEVIDELLAGARSEEEIVGPGGVLAQLTRRLVERVLSAELTEHLGYEPHQEPPGGTGNTRNGGTEKTLATERGPVRISTDLKAGDLTLTGGGVTFTRTVTGDAAIISQIMANPAGWYFNIHSTLHGGGVVRGQLTKA